MKKMIALSLVAVFAAAGTLRAEDAAKTSKVTSGPQDGDSLGAFYVTKIAGAEDDGVEEGKNLCYRCRNGARPQVVIFTRSTDPQVTALVQRLDKAVMENEAANLRVFVNVLGDDKEQAMETAKKFAASSKVSHIPFVVPNEFENGPDDYGINAKADVTILMASDLGVKANYAVNDAKQLNVDAVLKNLGKILN